MGDVLRISDSSLGQFSGCARKFELNKLYPRRRAKQRGFAADVGIALHAGYQTFLMTDSEDEALWAMMNAYPYDLAILQQKDDRSLDACIATLDEMINRNALYEYELAYIMRPATPSELEANPTQTLVRAPAIEVPFELNLLGITLPDGRSVKYTGFIDAIVRSRITGQFRTLDIKTHRRRVRDAESKYRFAGQQVPYGIVVDHVAGQSVDSFEVLYLDAFVDLVEPVVSLYPFTKNRHDLQEWLLDTVMEVERISNYMRIGHFPRTRGGCVSYSETCYFYEVCETRDRETMMGLLLAGEEPVEETPVVPWVVADIEVNA